MVWKGKKISPKKKNQKNQKTLPKLKNFIKTTFGAKLIQQSHWKSQRQQHLHYFEMKNQLKKEEKKAFTILKIQ